jgi:hypothetical protein
LHIHRIGSSDTACLHRERQSDTVTRQVGLGPSPRPHGALLARSPPRLPPQASCVGLYIPIRIAWQTPERTEADIRALAGRAELGAMGGGCRSSFPSACLEPARAPHAVHTSINVV